jgi:hypothetical protein
MGPVSPGRGLYFFKSAKDCVPLELGMMTLVGRGSCGEDGRTISRASKNCESSGISR